MPKNNVSKINVSKKKSTSASELIQSAVLVRDHAYAPYSKFKVGAAVEATSGKIYVGANVENRSYGLTVCAERNAIAAAVAAGERELKQICIVSGTAFAARPCGACREVMAEFNPALDILLVGKDKQITKTNLRLLFPEPFVFEKV